MKKENAGLKLRTKVGLIVILFSVVMIIAVSVSSYYSIRNRTLNFYTDKVVSNAVCAANLIPAEDAVQSLQTGAYTPELEKALRQWDQLKEVNHLKYLYLFTVGDTGITYIYTADASYDTPDIKCELGTFESFEDGDAQMRSVMETGKPSSSLDIMGSRWGYLASAFAPVMDENGNVVAEVGVDYDMESILSSIKTQVFASAGFFVLLILLFVGLLLFLMDYVVIRPIKILTDRASGMVSESTDTGNEELVIEDVHLKNRDEIGTLGQAFNDMAHSVERYVREIKDVTAEKEHIETELEVARKIQTMFLPRLEPPFTTMAGKRFAIYASMEAAKAVGGDFYDFYMIDREHLGVTIADVSGKGVPAALFMALSKTVLKNQVLAGKSPSQALTDSNAQLAETNDENMFVTVFMGILELKTGVFTYGNAGHNFPLLYRRETNAYEWVTMKPNFVLAAMDGIPYKQDSFVMKKGDRLLLYTDGVTEAMNEADELYGDDRLITFANKAMNEPEDTLGARVTVLKENIVEFRGEAQQSDDITILMMQYEGEDE